MLGSPGTDPWHWVQKLGWIWGIEGRVDSLGIPVCYILVRGNILLVFCWREIKRISKHTLKFAVTNLNRFIFSLMPPQLYLCWYASVQLNYLELSVRLPGDLAAVFCTHTGLFSLWITFSTIHRENCSKLANLSKVLFFFSRCSDQGHSPHNAEFKKKPTALKKNPQKYWKRKKLDVVQISPCMASPAQLY